MHLDTVFTQIDYDKFTYHPGIMGTLEVFEITKGKEEDEIRVKKMSNTLEKILEKYGDQCQLCGNKARIVHHIFPYKDFPQYMTEEWNLIPLCSHCHGLIETSKAARGELVGDGIKLLRKTAMEHNIPIPDKYNER